MLSFNIANLILGIDMWVANPLVPGPLKGSTYLNKFCLDIVTS